MIDDRLADELERIGVEGHASMLAQFAVAIRVASRRLDLSRWSMPSGPRHDQGMLEGSHHSLEGSHHSRL